MILVERFFCSRKISADARFFAPRQADQPDGNFDGDERPKRNRMTHFDVAPSILELIGFSGGVYSRFGLGVSVFSDVSAEEYGNHFDKVTSRDILNYSEVYESFHPDKK